MLHSASAVASAEISDGSGSRGARPAELEVEGESANDLGRRVAAREQDLWRFGVSLHALGTTRTRAERIREEIGRRLQSLGFRTRVPRFEAEPATSAPDLNGTETRPRDYWHVLHTDGVGAFFPFLDETVAEPGG
ncbi:MAG: hypothetical protein L3J96_04630, partial [Thermoplasmata archaeon]|nr:hypothetical protein [Thermoplasmata archaeon]